MIECSLRRPDGHVVLNPDVMQIHAVFQNPDPAYWGQGSGDVGLHSQAGFSFIVCTFVKPNRFCVVFEPSPDLLPQVLTSLDAPHGEEVVVMYGNPTRLPSGHLVSPENALDAMLAYLESGDPLRSGSWAVFDPILE